MPGWAIWIRAIAHELRRGHRPDYVLLDDYLTCLVCDLPPGFGSWVYGGVPA